MAYPFSSDTITGSIRPNTKLGEVASYGSKGSGKLPITSFNIKGIAPTQLASVPYEDYNIIM
jgi:hypothetical protein